jgi:dipeptidase D
VADPFAGLDPAPFWLHFEWLTRIPRAPYEEEQAAAYVIAWAEARGWHTRRDAARNLVVAVPATPGRERAATVILQGHLDMVCEREPDSPYDPRAGRIRLVRDGEWVRADGTTLGADDGVAIAAMMAVAEGDAPHGPLELLMTVEEEVGLGGAARLDPELIGGTVLLNLDSEEDATLTVGCAGSIDTRVRLEAARAPVDGPLVRVRVHGGRGGHSGVDIALGRANAIKALARALRAAPELRIVSLDGGSARNAIPRDATAVVSAGEEARAAIAAEAARIADAYRSTDPGVRVTVADELPPGPGEGSSAADEPPPGPGEGSPAADEPPPGPGEAAPAAGGATAWSRDDSARILDLIAAIPVGPLGMSADFPGTVETSSSLGAVATDGATLTIRSLSRSANDALMTDVTNAIAAAARLAAAAYEPGQGYPAWRPDLDSPLLAAAKAAHVRELGTEPRVTLTHGGLEAAIIAAKRPGLDAISFGPQIEGPHAPGERLHIGSAGRFMRLLGALLDDLSRGA